MEETRRAGSGFSRRVPPRPVVWTREKGFARGGTEESTTTTTLTTPPPSPSLMGAGAGRQAGSAVKGHPGRLFCCVASRLPVADPGGTGGVCVGAV